MKNPSQIEMAETLLTELVEEFEGVSEISPLDLLDMLEAELNLALDSEMSLITL